MSGLVCRQSTLKGMRNIVVQIWLCERRILNKALHSARKHDKSLHSPAHRLCSGLLQTATTVKFGMGASTASQRPSETSTGGPAGSQCWGIMSLTYDSYRQKLSAASKSEPNFQYFLCNCYIILTWSIVGCVIVNRQV